jgi:L-alanine-DL-glutamate epimerase-like enolase superfamily enzyme
MQGWRPLVALAALVCCSAVHAQSTVQRCESRDGKVTYSNTQCPAGTAPVRKVNTDPPVSVEEKRAAEQLAKKESAAAKQVDRDHAKDEAREKKQAEERAKAAAKARDRCERARHDVERARATRGELTDRSALSVDAMQKADREIARREALAAKECKQ